MMETTVTREDNRFCPLEFGIRLGKLLSGPIKTKTRGSQQEGL
jgi:hypothetical protein